MSWKLQIYFLASNLGAFLYSVISQRKIIVILQWHLQAFEGPDMVCTSQGICRDVTFSCAIGIRVKVARGCF